MTAQNLLTNPAENNGFIRPNPSMFPLELTRLPNWVVWRAEKRSDSEKKPTKVPYRCDIDNVRASTTDPETWGTLMQAKSAFYEEGSDFTGIGFVLDGKGIAGVDIDGCVDPNTLQVNPAAMALLERLDAAYIEISPSGTGLRAFGYADPLQSGRTGMLDGIKVEFYTSARYLTLTGETIKWDGRLRPFKNFSQEAARISARDNQEPARSTSGSVQVVSPQTIAELRSALLSMRSDDRDLWQRMGHALKTLGDVGRGLWLEWSATSDAFRPKEDAKSWDSFNPNRTDYRAVFAEAQRHGWVNPLSNAASIIDAIEPSDARKLIEESLVSLDSRPTHEIMPHLVEKWIPQDEVTMLAGHGGGGKSYVALNLAVHIATGRAFGGLQTRQAGVLYFSGEDGAQILLSRLEKICRALGIDQSELKGKLHLLDASDIDPALHREQRVTVNGRQAVVTETTLLSELSDLTRRLDIGLVVIDNASDAYDDDEIKRARARSFIRSLRSRIARPGRAVLLLAHINKTSANSGRKAGTEDYSGSTAWHNSVRSRLSLTTEGDGSLKIEHLKANLGVRAEPVMLQWHEGVPMVTGTFSNHGAAAAAAILDKAERDRDNADKDALVQIIRDFDRRGERITAAAQGPYTAHRLLKSEPGFPKNTGSDRLMRLLRELDREGRIFRRFIRTPDRKEREIYTCSFAPIPETDQASNGKNQESEVEHES